MGVKRPPARKRADTDNALDAERFRVTLASIGDAVISTDTNGLVTFLNPVAESMTGWQSQDAIGQSLDIVCRILDDRTRLVTPNPVTRVLREGRVVALPDHATLVSKDGREWLIEDSAAPIKDASGQIAGAVMVFHDVTERRQAEKGMRESEQRLRAIFDQAAVGIAVANLDGRFTEMNDRFCRILGYPADELRQKTFLDLTYREDLAVTQKAASELRQRKIPEYSMEKRYVRKDGSVIWSFTTVALLTDSNDAPYQFIGVIDDITARKLAEAEVQQNAQRLKLAMDGGNLGDWSWDSASDRLHLGSRAQAILGISDTDTIAWTELRKMLHRDEGERSRNTVEAAKEARTDFTLEYRVSHSRGEDRWAAVRGRGVYAPDGSVLGLTGVVQDVTERKRAEHALQEEARTLELLNETGKAIAASLDVQTLRQIVTDKATMLTNAKFGAFFYNTTDENGDSFMLFAMSGATREAFEKFGQPRATPLFAPTFRGEAPIRCDDVLLDPRYGKAEPHRGMPEGHLPVRSYLAVPVISRSGSVIGGLFFGHPEPGVFTERAEKLVVGVAAQAAVAIDNALLYEAAQKASEDRKYLLESERSARHAAVRLSEMKDHFLSTLSHELRTPLSAILGWSQVLKQGPKDLEDLQTGLDKIERNANIQTKLIEDLLDMSQITSGKVRLDVQPIFPFATVDAALESVRVTAESKGVQIEKNMDPAAGPIAGDAGRLRQIVWNLLSNAIKFTPKGGKVEVALRRTESHVEISVADSGIGIDAEYLEHVFDRFRQAEASTTRRYGGLGIGLSVVKQLVELHGGSVHAKSAGEGKGATFAVRLPVLVAHTGADREMGFHARSLTGAPELEALNLSGISVIVVDDEPDARDLVSRVLSESGATVAATSNAEEAIALIERDRPHMLITDIGMPDVDGFELLRRVRALGEARGGKLPAIALTAFARSEDRTRALRAGFQVHLTKPVDPSELIATVANVAGRTDDWDMKG